MEMRSFNARAVLFAFAALLTLAGTETTLPASAVEVAAASIAEHDAASAPARHGTGSVPGLVRVNDARPAEWETIAIVVYKSKRALALYRSGNFDKEFPIVLGLVPGGRKRYANDARTPEGLYHITDKRRHDKWQYFLALDYPNARDQSAYAEELVSGKIPDENGKPFAIGGAIGIHGNDRAQLQDARVDWTKGCIAMKAADIVELAGIAGVGTPVWIVE